MGPVNFYDPTIFSEKLTNNQPIPRNQYKEKHISQIVEIKEESFRIFK